MHSLQQEKVRDIINSRHIWHFLSKWQIFIKLWWLLGFTSTQGWCSGRFPSIRLCTTCTSLHFELFLHSQTQFLMLTLGLLKTSCQTHCYQLSLFSARVLWEVAETRLAPHALRSSSGLPAHATGMLFYLSLLWLQGPWSHTMTLLLFTDALARKLQQSGCGSKWQIMKNRENRALESLNEQSLWLHGWVQASFRLSGTLAENC